MKGIRRYYEQYQMPKLDILGKALKLYLNQISSNISNKSEISIHCAMVSRMAYYWKIAGNEFAGKRHPGSTRIAFESTRS